MSAKVAQEVRRRVGLDEVRAQRVRRVAGLISGTSMDGLDIALCRIAPGDDLKVELQDFAMEPFPAELRAALEVGRLDLAGLARAHLALGGFFAEALAKLLSQHDFPVDLIGSHGQTVYHEHGVTTLQLGDPGALTLRFNCPVVHDFRTNDIAAGGCGAPLVPYVDHRLLARHGPLLAVNLGGIANLTYIPEKGSIDKVLGMDCGPANMVLDELARRYTGGRAACDLDGRLAAQGQVHAAWLARLTGHPVFTEPPPKSVGREQFGAGYVDELLGEFAPASAADWQDLLATATELAAFGVAEAWRRFVAPAGPIRQVVVGGGGARNPELMRRLAARFAPIPVRPSDAVGLPVDAKEAIAFAVLASDRIDGRPTNVPSVTGAQRRVLLGRITEG
jgi:anhydro-N-acetylmuramic acid kinase